RTRPFDGRPEVEVVALAKAGDPSAFGELAQRNYHRSRRLAHSVIPNAAAAHDAVGEAFCKAFEHLDQFESSGHFSSWLNRIVINECYQILRSGRRTEAVEFEERAHTPEFRPESSHSLTPEEQLRYSELLAALVREISRIPAHLRKPLLMRANDQPIQEIAEQMGLSEAAVKSRVSRARTHLRIRLSRHLPARYAHA
ncbi:MAG TPA: sigma-70 family RNA polymerase sigma factor, partial [Candidatus Methylomirabilis sp.]|nr:sigma-70 family RNA polymerase sigma factor [Candidatus Methylomirabilis sp.]